MGRIEKKCAQKVEIVIFTMVWGACCEGGTDFEKNDVFCIDGALIIIIIIESNDPMAFPPAMHR